MPIKQVFGKRKIHLALSVENIAMLHALATTRAESVGDALDNVLTELRESKPGTALEFDFGSNDLLVVEFPKRLTVEDRVRAYTQIKHAIEQPGRTALILDGGTTCKVLKR